MFKKGDVVSFGRPNGEKTEAIVLRVNGKSLLVETTEARGLQRVRQAGKKWRVPNDTRFVTLVTSASKWVSQDINENEFAAEQEEHNGR